jgi:hypothetical protein
VHTQDFKSMIALALGFTHQKTYLKGGRRGSESAPSSSPFFFLLTVPTFSLTFWFFLLFVCVFRPDQHFWHFLYTSAHLPPCYVVHFFPDHCCCLLVVFLLWIKVFFSLDMPLWAIYGMEVSQVWEVISYGLDSSV